MESNTTKKSMEHTYGYPVYAKTPMEAIRLSMYQVGDIFRWNDLFGKDSYFAADDICQIIGVYAFPATIPTTMAKVADSYYHITVSMEKEKNV